MALTELQRAVCRLLAENPREVDLFHDTDEALATSWQADRTLLETRGFDVLVVRERPSLVEAEVSAEGERVRMEWARDSAFRFLPLQHHDDLGLTLHPFDLATNKVLALVGRLEVRDWVDVIASDDRLQPLGYLAWAACAKDPGFGPAAILEGAARSGRYSAEEVRQLAFSGDPPDAAELARAWHRILDSARQIVSLLPPGNGGTCVLDASGGLFRGSPVGLSEALRDGGILFHQGRIRGSLPARRL